MEMRGEPMSDVKVRDDVLVAARFKPNELHALDELMTRTGWNRGQALRRSVAIVVERLRADGVQVPTGAMR
jgi:hypothetical protein